MKREYLKVSFFQRGSDGISHFYRLVTVVAVTGCLMLSMSSTEAQNPTANSGTQTLGPRRGTTSGARQGTAVSSHLVKTMPSAQVQTLPVRVAAPLASQWWGQNGGRFHRSTDPKRPAILLFHGLHQSSESWTRPSSIQQNFDYRHTPVDRDLGTNSTPNVGIYKVGESNILNVDEANWFDYLARLNFTVATWSQPGITFNNAYPSAQQALDQFVKDTAVANPALPPPIALIGHSRGGLLIRKLLKEKGNMGGRIRWVITLHSPHSGSEMARAPRQIANYISNQFESLPSEIRGEIKRLALQLVLPLNRFVDDGSRELAPGGPLVTSLASGETPVDGVKYYTFGGVNPTYFKLYTWLFTLDSSVPQTKVVTHGFDSRVEVYFHWKVKAAEVPLGSPLLDKLPDFAEEIRPERGDGLVADASARLPFSIHQTDHLNHAEVLWDHNLQVKVAQILSGPLKPIHILNR